MKKKIQIINKNNSFLVYLIFTLIYKPIIALQSKELLRLFNHRLVNFLNFFLETQRILQKYVYLQLNFKQLLDTRTKTTYDEEKATV